MSTRNLDKLFDPKTIAVIGASNKKGSVGYILLRNLIGAEYEGVVYPVNPTSPSVQGIQAYASISQVPRKIDLAVIAVPAKAVPDTVRECGEAGVAGAVIVSSGFREIGAEGRKLEEQVRSIAESYSLRIVGPNCLGYTRPASHLNVTFAHVTPPEGRIAFFSQSGALGTAILDWAASNKVGFSAFVSVGSMCDVDFGDLIDYFGADAHTSSIILYVESITDARHFMSAARHFAKTKPIIVVKSGRHARSALAAASHTGAIAGDDTLYSAVFRRAGIVRVDEIEDMFDSAEVLSRVTSPRGPRLGIVTNAGGPGVMASDRLLSLGGELAELSAETDEKLKAALPGFAARGNPVDVAGDAGADALRDGRGGAHGRPGGRRRPRHPHAPGDERPDRRPRRRWSRWRGSTRRSRSSPRSWARSRSPRRCGSSTTSTSPRSTRPRTRFAPTSTCTSTPRTSPTSTRRRPTSSPTSSPTGTR